jgi:3-oxoacyl-[acyl-carrier-protein] synthase II
MGLLRQSLLGRLTTRGNDDPPGACRPFDADHAGTVIGEGGGLLILEDRQRAEARQARIYAEVAGFGAACDPEGIAYPRPATGGVAPAIRAALKDARIAPDEVDLVIPLGTAVPAEDVAEARALHEALGERARSVPVVPLAGAFGNLFAGAGAVNLTVAAAALHRQTVLPAVNARFCDDACRLNLPRQPLEAPLRHALCSAFSLGGQSAALVLKRYQP